MDALPKLTVGQKVWVDDVNRRGRPREEATVTKVGRKLVTVDRGYHSQVFRLDTGRSNDDFGHQWLLTAEMVAQADERAILRGRVQRLRYGRDLAAGPWSNETLAAVLDLLEKEVDQ